jgi:RecA/RadA recombinase
MPQYFKDLGPGLVQAGYSIVPIRPGSKRPRGDGWQKMALTRQDVIRMGANRSHADGVGILASSTPAIDVDILDTNVSQEMSTIIEYLFPNQLLLFRTGKAPKFLIPFQSIEPFRKLTSNTYTDGTHDHKVEILGDGQSWTAYHLHPDTGKPYEWFDGIDSEGITSVEHNCLPVLQREDAIKVIEAFEDIAQKLCDSGTWKNKNHTGSASTKILESKQKDPFAPFVEPLKISKENINYLLSKCDSDSYDRWIDVGMMLHHQFSASDEGLEIWESWSATGTKYSPDVCSERWGSFGRRDDAPKTFKALIKEFGLQKSSTEVTKSISSVPLSFIQAAKFTAERKLEWLIKHILPKKGLVVVYGDPGSGKSFYVLDLVAHVARGIAWNGKRTKQASVAYLAAEGTVGFGNRLKAYSKGNGVSLEGFPLFVYGGAFDLKQQPLELSEVIVQMGGVELIVIDTLSAVTAGANENTSEEMGSAIKAAQLIIELTSATVILIHHSNKGGDIRGWSGLKAAVDNQIRIERKGDIRTAHVEKMKDEKDGGAYGFKLKVVELGEDEDGDIVSSCIVEQSEEQAPNTNFRVPPGPTKDLSGKFETSVNYAKARKFLEIIQDLIGLEGANVCESDVISALQNDDTVNPLKEEGYPPARTIKRTLLTLAENGKIRREGQWIRLCGDF